MLLVDISYVDFCCLSVWGSLCWLLEFVYWFCLLWFLLVLICYFWLFRVWCLVFVGCLIVVCVGIRVFDALLIVGLCCGLLNSVAWFLYAYLPDRLLVYFCMVDFILLVCLMVIACFFGCLIVLVL